MQRSAQKPWEPNDYSEMEARLAAAKQLRRDELGTWLGDVWRGLVDAIAPHGASERPNREHPSA